ncbi:uncharacterized protein K444DRAFT_529477 [Hyaloscypha bicolor E]|uniref:Uncharacterized protein n=1 Tax=Hyaloscypha bicolor E TaxID=1095630 RepID=A0A2J6T9V0_9HELO|nr:uncharacterized protein K444DRAFT_529477 [Hyaloscypha bicolor E]PMD59806.1 hypothetical protein K444DRAFT_529477 [Hyaloscypha bicolor E]
MLGPRRNGGGWRFSSTEAQGQKPVSPHVGFYRTFTRPVAKVLLMATFTYQLAYWGWVKLEKEEIKRSRSAEIEVLEKQLGDLTKKDGKP